MSDKREIEWLTEPEEKDYPAAGSFLGLLFGEDEVVEIVKRLRAAPMSGFKAKDIFRASGLSLPGVSNSHVEKDRKRISEGKALSPVLLVRDTRNRKLIVADGYHRLCAVYQVNEDEWVPCKIV